MNKTYYKAEKDPWIVVYAPPHPPPKPKTLEETINDMSDEEAGSYLEKKKSELEKIEDLISKKNLNEI